MDKVVWFELPADDTERASNFYSRTFGWNMSDMGGGNMMAVTAPSDDQGQPIQNGAINGDISARTDTLTQPTIVIQVENIEEKIQKVEAAGGRVVKERTDMPELKTAFALVADTEGNVVGLVQDL